MLYLFSQFKDIKNGKDRFKQPPASALLCKRLTGDTNADANEYSSALGKFKIGYSSIGKK